MNKIQSIMLLDSIKFICLKATVYIPNERKEKSDVKKKKQNQKLKKLKS